MYKYTEHYDRHEPKPEIPAAQRPKFRTRPGDMPLKLRQIAARYHGSIRRDEYDALHEAARLIVRMQERQT